MTKAGAVAIAKASGVAMPVGSSGALLITDTSLASASGKWGDMIFAFMSGASKVVSRRRGCALPVGSVDTSLAGASGKDTSLASASSQWGDMRLAVMSGISEVVSQRQDGGLRGR